MGRNSLRYLAAILLMATAIAVVAASSEWTIVPSPNTGDTNYLYGVSAVSASNVWAVGYVYKNTLQSTLVEH